jgi:hypothetical protein
MGCAAAVLGHCDWICESFADPLFEVDLVVDPIAAFLAHQKQSFAFGF